MVEKDEKFFSEKNGKNLVIIGFVLIVTAILLFIIFGSWSLSKTLDESKVGQFGDLIGGLVGSLFSLSGVILFYVALKEQRRDININQENLKLQTEALNRQVEEFKEQKVELEETRKIYIEQTGLIREQTNLYKLQNNELKEQTNTSKLQQFDSSFFSYLEVLSNLKNSYNSSINDDYFYILFDELRSISIEDKTLPDSLMLIEEKYFQIFNKYRDKLSIYLKTIYRIMVLIDSSNIDDYKKQQYFKLLRSQLTEKELLILHYNYQTELGIKARSFVIKYNFLKHLKILDRIEFNNDLSDNNKYNLENFLSFIVIKVNESLKKYSSIEEIDDVNISINSDLFKIFCAINILIKDFFELSIVFKKLEFDNNSIIKRDEFKKVIEIHLYSILFLSKYKKFNGDEVIVSIIEYNNELEFKYVVNQIENI